MLGNSGKNTDMVKIIYITCEFGFHLYNFQYLTFAQEEMEVFLNGAGVAGTPWMLPGGSDILLKKKQFCENEVVVLVSVYPSSTTLSKYH